MRATLLALVAGVALLSSAALAQTVTKEALVQACGPDVSRLCPNVQPGMGRIKACMKQHIAAISMPCMDVLLDARAMNQLEVSKGH